MTGDNGGAASRWRRRLSGLGAPALAGLAIVALTVMGGLATVGYRTYDWVEHDNEFCLSCHLMEDPYQRFAESAHQDLGCKVCHKPTLLGRSAMGLTQILEQPDSLGVHAEVPNEKCEACHVDGDPEEWSNIANTAGHRVHFESADSALDDLACVQCHSTTVHGFAATDQTCAQSGCHTDVEIQLGRMSDLTIHCASCHGFNVEVERAPAGAAAGAELADALRPDAQQCLSCHQMQVLVDMPEDEPHQGTCATCHNPHTQSTPQQAVETCAISACHTDPLDISAFHVGLPDSTVADCSTCHSAHVFRVDGSDCAACHQDMDAPATGPAALAAPAGAFDHERHRDVTCATCHDVSTSHGQVVVSEPGDCRSCHHTEPLRANCVSCHDAEDTPEATLPVTRPFTPSIGDPGTRTLDFQHDVHTDIDCATCHTEGNALSAEGTDCMSCHEDHHEPDARCISCHVRPPVGAHSVDAHLNCINCHVEAPAAVAAIPRTRDFCVSCHVDLEDHRPDGNCEECHTLPDPVGGGGA